MQAVLFVECELGFELELGFFDGLGKVLQLLLVGEIGFLFEVAFGQQLDELAARAAGERASRRPDRIPGCSAGTA